MVRAIWSVNKTSRHRRIFRRRGPIRRDGRRYGYCNSRQYNASPAACFICFGDAAMMLSGSRALCAHAPRVTETLSTWRVSRARARAVYDHVAMHFLFRSAAGFECANDRIPPKPKRRQPLVATQLLSRRTASHTHTHTPHCRDVIASRGHPGSADQIHHAGSPVY